MPRRFRKTCGSIGILLASAAAGVCLESAPRGTVSIILGDSVARLNGPWRFHTGDDPAWALPGFDDSTWESVDLSPLKAGSDPLLGTSYKPGWTGSGHRGYHGYAWYRLRVHLSKPPAGTTRLLMPENVDDGYEVYVNGVRMMSFGDFSAHPPRVFLSDQVVASAMPADTDLTIAIRFWMSQGTAERYRNAGGLHAPPVFGLASAVGLAEIAFVNSVLRVSIVGTLKALSMLCLAAFALLLYSQDRSERFICLLGIAALLEASLSFLILAGGTTYLFDIATVSRLRSMVLYPATGAAWAFVWIEWFGLRRYRWLRNSVWGLTAAIAILRFLHLDPAAPHGLPGGAWAVAVARSDYWVRVLAALLFVGIVAWGIRLRGREGWLALLVAVLRSVEIFNSDLGLYRFTLNWFPAGIRVQFFDLTGFLMVGALAVAVLQRFGQAQRRTQELALRREQAETTLREVEAQKRKTDAMLLNILPAAVAEELHRNGSVQPMYFEDVTVCFTDFVGFGKSTMKLAAQDVVNELNGYFTAFDRIIDRYGLEKLKTIGDSYMFVSGLPLRSPANPVNAVLAALEIAETVRIMGETLSGVNWQVRVGLHTGPVVAGVVGIRKFAFDIWGETVNFASRMESCGEPNRVNMSEHTFARVKDFIEVKHRGRISTKEGQEMNMYFVAGVLPGLLTDCSACPPPRFEERYLLYFREKLPAFPRHLLLQSNGIDPKPATLCADTAG